MLGLFRITHVIWIVKERKTIGRSRRFTKSAFITLRYI